MSFLRRAIIAMAALFASIVAPQAALAQTATPSSPAQLTQRTSTIDNDGGTVKISMSYPDVFDAEIKKRIDSYLQTVVVTNALLFTATGSTPLAVATKECTIHKDLWDDLYYIDVTEGGATTKSVVVSVAGVIRVCGSANKLGLMSYAQMNAATTYLVATLIEVDPMSAQTKALIKSWITQPSGNTGIGPGGAVFGSFVGLFVPKISSSRKSVSFRSQLFTPPAPPPPPKPSP